MPTSSRFKCREALGFIVASAFLPLALAACTVSTQQKPQQAGPTTPSPSPSPSPAVSGLQLPQPSFDVTKFGARGDGSSDSTSGVRAAIQAAQRHGSGTVYFPAGRYMVSAAGERGASVQIEGNVPIAIAGAGRDQSSLIETASGKDLLSIKSNGSIVTHITLDTQSHGGRAAIVVVADHTTLQEARVLGGDKAFAIYYAGPKGATPANPSYNEGNRAIDVELKDGVSDDGFSWSFQSDGVIQNIKHTGSRLALYVDRNVTVENYRYSPGNQPHAKDGFYITPPSSNITLHGFTSSGSGGIVGANTSRASSNIVIDGLQLLGSGNRLLIGDVRGVTVTNSQLGSNNWMVIRPDVTADSITVSNSSLSAVRFRGPKGAQVTNARFDNDTFLPFSPPPGDSAATFFNVTGTSVRVTVTGGSWMNPGGFSQGDSNVQVAGLQGYSR